mmetsp:Transcript_61684/g.114501  ORF Transcript_61684/g.114501 Transcript_61684/m.114501 type:complete len:256 (-) Transcript_61684:25-792(-)
MHGIAAGSEWLALQAPVWCGSCCFAIDHIASDGEHREGRASVAVQLVLAKLSIESLAHLHSQGVNTIVVVSKAGQLQTSILTPEANCESFLVPDWVDLPIADGSQGICHDRQASDAERHQSIHIRVVERHLHALIVGVIMRVVDAVHGVRVELGHPGHGDVKEEPGDDVEVQRSLLIASTNASFCTCIGKALAKQVTMALISSAVEAHQQELHQVRASAKELHIDAYPHGRDAAGNGIVGSKDWAHEVIVLVLDA